MSYCINPDCQNPQNTEGTAICQSCGSSLLLKDRYRAIKPLGQSISSRTFLAKDLDKPAKTYCTIKQFIARDQVKDLVANPQIANSKFAGDPVQLDKIGKHPQIPELLAAFEQEGHFYLIQEYIQGPSLAADLAEEGVMSEGHIWEVLGQMLPVLDFIHDRQVIHGDIKPENILCRHQEGTKTPELVLVDFGIGNDDSGELLPQPVSVLENYKPFYGESQPFGAMNGSAEYIAPEQTKGTIYANSDLYSLGVTCIHLLTQVPAFDLYDVKSEKWVWRDYLKKPVSHHLGRVLDKLVERNPKKRYQSAKEVLQDLKYGPRPIEAVLQKPKYVFSAWAGAAVVLLCMFLSSRILSPVRQTSFNATEPTANMPNEGFPQPKLEDFKPEISKIDPLREFPAKGVQRLSPLRTLAVTTNNVWSVAVSPNSPIVASGGMDGTIELLHLHTGKTIRTLSGHYGPVWSVAVSPDGRTLVTGGGDGTIKVWNLYSGRLKRTLYGHDAGVFSVAISADGRAIASGSKDQTVKVWNLNTGAELDTLYGHTDEVQSVAFSTDGETLASGSNDGTVKVWNWRYGIPVRTFKGHDGPVWAVTISPDGQTLASGSWDNTIKLWDLKSGEYRRVSWWPVRTLIGHSEKVQSLAFSPDGQTLASGDFGGTIKLWNFNTGALKGTLKGHTSWVDLAFDPFNNNLISGSFDDTIKVWGLSSRERF